MSDELRRKDDIRYHAMHETMEDLKKVIDSISGDIKEDHAMLYEKNGVFDSLGEHTHQIEGLTIKISDLDRK